MLGWRAVRGGGVAFGLSLLWAASAAAKLPDGSGAGGARWQDPIVRITVDGSVADMDGGAFDAVIDAISAWQAVDPYLPTLIVEQADKSKGIGFDPAGGNQNTVVFQPSGAPIAKGALAITIITFDQASGRVLDADIVVNGEHRFGVMETMAEDKAPGAYDLQNVLTHEFGHFLGLGEEYKEDTATMYAYSLPGETQKRDLDASDTDKISTLYTEQTYTETEQAGCSASVAGGLKQYRSWSLLALGALGFVLAARRRSVVYAGISSAVLGAFLVVGATNAAYDAEVRALESHWEGGVIVTTAELRPLDCSNACQNEHVTVYGGTVDGISQQVGLLRPLRVGDQVHVAQDGEAGRHGTSALSIKE